MANGPIGDISSLSNAQLLAMNNQYNTPGGNIYTAAINENESRGKGDSSTITNPSSGAQGSMQTMGPTLKDPGYGVTPWNGTQADKARVGRDYYNALNNHYGDPSLAAIAYNWGPGNTDMWLKSGADVSKLPNETLKYVDRFNQNIGAMGGGPQGADVAPPPVTTGGGAAPNAGGGTPSRGYMTMDEFNAANPASNAPALQEGSGNPIAALGAGLGGGFGTQMLGLQDLAGKGLSALGMDTPGNWLQKNAEEGKKNLEEQMQKVGGGGIAQKAGEFVGGAAPYLVGGAEVLPMVATGAVGNAGQAALNNQPILPAAIEGGGMGAAGYVGGKALEGLGGAVTKGIKGVAASPEDQAAAHIAKNLPDVQGTINELGANADNAVAGGAGRTAAEAAPGSPELKAMQDAAAKTGAGEGVFQEGAAANQAAQVDHMNAAVDNTLAGDKQAFSTAQDNLAAQGQGELPPMNPDFANSGAVAQDTAMQKAIKQARADSAGTANDPFAIATDAAHADAGTKLEQLIGTPEQLAEAKAARAAQAAKDYGEVSGYVPLNTPGLADVMARDGYQDAAKAASDTLSNFKGEGTPPDWVKGEGPAGQWVPKQISVQHLMMTKQELENQVSAALRAGHWQDAAGLIDTKNSLAKVLNDNVGAFSEANQRYAAASAPISRMQALQDRLVNAYDTNGQLRPDKIAGAIDSLRMQQQKLYATAADHVTPQDLQALGDIANQARGAKTTVANLSPEGQKAVLQQLQANAAKVPDANSVQARALKAFEDYLSGQSNSYAAHFNAQRSIGQDLTERQMRQDILAKAVDKINAIHGGGGTLSMKSVGEDLKKVINAGGPEGQAARSLLNDLSNSANVNAAGIKGDVPQFGGAAGQILGHELGKHGVWASVLSGHIPHAIASYFGSRFLEAGQGKVEQAMVDLLKHGNADKLREALIRTQQKAATSSGGGGLLSNLGGAAVPAGQTVGSP